MKDNFYAHSLLVKQHYGELTPHEEQELNNLLAKDDKLRAIQAEIQKVPFEEAQSFTKELNTEAALAEVYQRATSIKRRRSVIKALSITMASAAAVFAAVVIFRINSDVQSVTEHASVIANGANLILANGEVIPMQDSGRQLVTAGAVPMSNTNRSLTFDNTVSATLGLNTLNVPAKLDFKIELSDGTKVWLNSATKFRFPFSFDNKSRDVYIDEGEAYFIIAPDANKPFTVHTVEGPIQVLGTEFNVNAYTKNKIITSLVSGKVAVSAGKQKIELKPGSEIVVQNGQVEENRSFDQLNTLCWMEGIHYFNNAKISDVGIMLQRWFNIKLIIDNPQAAQTEIRGKLFRNQPIDKFIQQINYTKVITFYWINNELHCK